MYEINQSLDASGITGATPIPVGINENCTFKGMEVYRMGFDGCR